MNIEQLAEESYKEQKQSGKVTLSLADPESSYMLGFSKGVLAGMDYAAALIKLQGEEAPTLNRQDKIELSEENIKTLHY